LVERDRAVTTTSTDTAAVLLTGHAPVRLRPGRVSTDPHSSRVVTFRVPPGWYGYQHETGFVLGMSFVGDEVDLRPGGITVYVLDSPIAQAARWLAQLKAIQVKSPVRIGGSLGRRYARRLGYQPFRDVTLDALGLPGVVPSSPDLILLGAGGKTLVIRRAFTTDAGRTEVDGVLMSFRFPYIAQVSAICSAAVDALRSAEANLELDWNRLDDGEVAWIKAAVRSTRNSLTALRALTPPTPDRAAIKHVLSLMAKQIELHRESAKAISAGHIRRALPILDKSLALEREKDRVVIGADLNTLLRCP
jgi:hypothetical protein